MTNAEAIYKLKSVCNKCEEFPKCVNTDSECFKAIEMAISALEKQTNTAEWLSQNGEYVCSECGYEVWGSGISVMNEWKYCPNCGARCVDKKKGGIE